MKLCTISSFVPIAFLLTLLPRWAHAWGAKSEEQQKSDRFFKCLLAIESADEDQDNRLDSDEYDSFVDQYSVLLFDESMSTVPADIHALYKSLVQTSKAPTGEELIDVFGANFFDLANVDQARINALHEVCESVAKAIVGHGHTTEAPVMLNLEHLLKEEGDGEH